MTSRGEREEMPVTGKFEYISILKKYFGIDLEEADVRNFMRNTGNNADTFTA